IVGRLGASAAVESETLLALRVRLRDGPCPGRSGQRAQSHGVVARLHGGVVVDDPIRDALQRRDIGGNGDDAEGTHHRDVRRDPLHDGQRRLGWRTSTESAQLELSGATSGHSSVTAFPGHMDAGPRISRLRLTCSLLQERGSSGATVERGAEAQYRRTRQCKHLRGTDSDLHGGTCAELYRPARWRKLWRFPLDLRSDNESRWRAMHAPGLSGCHFRYATPRRIREIATGQHGVAV